MKPGDRVFSLHHKYQEKEEGLARLSGKRSYGAISGPTSTRLGGGRKPTRPEDSGGRAGFPHTTSKEAE